MENVMNSAGSRRRPDYKIQLSHATGVVQQAGSESKEGPSTTTASLAESLLAAEKRALEMIADGASLTDILDHVCTSIDAQTSPSITSILLMDADGQKLWPSAGPRVPQDWARAISPLPVAPDTGLCGTAAFLKTRVIVPDVATEPIWREEYRQVALKNGIRAAWSQPILTKDNQVLGTFAIYSSEARMPMREDLALVEAAGHIALIAIERQRSQAALALALEKIKMNEESLRLLVDTIPGLVVTTTPAGEIEHLNRQVLEYFDKTPEELANWRISDAIHPDDLPLTIAAFTRSIQTGEPYEVEHHLRRADGVYRWFHARGLALRDREGSIVRWYYLLTDVDDRRRAEEALRKSEALLHEAQRLARTGSWSWDVLSGRVVSSPENARIYGFQPNEDSAAPEVYFQRIHPDHRERIREVFQTCVVEKTDYQADYPIVLLDGTVKYIHATGHPILNKSGDLIEFFGTTVDVTEQHEARAALQTAFEQIKAEETELRRMTDAIASYIYVLRPDGTALYANQTLLDYTGLTLEHVQREDQRARVFHPEDLERLREERQGAFACGKPFELEQRALGKDGNYRWFLVRYNPLCDDQGHIIRWYATGTDIEDRKRAEERMRDENLALREQIDQAFMFEEIVGASPALQNVLSSIVKVAPTDSTVLITGETGTGKELIARAIHKHSQRSGQAFISVNCASIPSSLIASELFGHEKGAFTGAVQRRQGRFELAHSGTIFLDEVGDLPAETQIALLRVLQERQFERVGGNRVLPTNVRVIAATNRDLTSAIAAGTFRADLFYRLNVFPIEVPPLRKRKEDIPMLVEYFVKRYAEKAGKQIRKIDNNTLERCQSYAWPGNIRELQNIVERSVIFCSSGDTFWIEKAWLTGAQPPRQELAGPLPDTLQNQERKIIETALTESKGKVAGLEGAAAKLGIPRSTLDSKIKQLNIKKHKFMAEG
jgi:PAS domain S-box-containing protein